MGRFAERYESSARLPVITRSSLAGNDQRSRDEQAGDDRDLVTKREVREQTNPEWTDVRGCSVEWHPHKSWKDEPEDHLPYEKAQDSPSRKPMGNGVGKPM